MAFESNIAPTIIGLYDQELLVSYFPPNNLGSYIKRTELENAHHTLNALNNHPTLSNVVNCFNGHVFLNGNIRVEWEWESNQISESDIDAYLNEIPPNFSNYTFTKNIAENKLYADISTNWVSESWINNHLNWQIAAPKAKLILNSEDAAMLCVTRLNGTYSNYTFDNRTIEPNETITITRPDCEKCFLIFSKSLYSNDKELKPLKMYKQVNSSLQVTNQNDSRVKIFRYIK